MDLEENLDEYRGYSSFSKKTDKKVDTLEFSAKEEEYKRASLILERRVGTLKKTPLVLAILCIVAIACVFLLTNMNPTNHNFISFIVFAIVFLVVFIFSFYVEPRIIKNNAKKDYDGSEKILYPTKLTLFLDEMILETPYIKSRESYAKMVCCVEMSDIFILIKDRHRLTVIPKSVLSPSQTEKISDFLRNTFARRHYNMKNWIF